MSKVNHTEVRMKMRMKDITQFDVAKLMGDASHSTLNQWLNGHKEMPDVFGKRVSRAVELLDRANTAARTARQNVLSEAKDGI